MEDRELINLFLDELRKDNFSAYTISNYEKDINGFYEFIISEKLARSLTGVTRVRVCQHYIANLSKEKYNAKSINRHLSSLRSFYNYLVKENYISFNPFTEVHNVKTEKNLPKFIDNEDIIDLINNIDTKKPLGKRNKLIIELLFATGMRVSELCSLETRQIDFYNDEIKVFGKGKKERIVYLYDSLSHDLNTYINYTRNELLAKSMKEDITNVFINYKGTALTPRGVRKIINSEIEKRSLNLHISPHMLRHSFATAMLNNGLDLRSVQTLLGHENLATTQIYTHVSQANIRKTFDETFPRNKKID